MMTMRIKTKYLFGKPFNISIIQISKSKNKRQQYTSGALMGPKFMILEFVSVWEVGKEAITARRQRQKEPYLYGPSCSHGYEHQPKQSIPGCSFNSTPHPLFFFLTTRYFGEDLNCGRYF